MPTTPDSYKRSNRFYRKRYGAMSGKHLQRRMKNMRARIASDETGAKADASIKRRLKLARITQENKTFKRELGSDFRRQIYGKKFAPRAMKAYKTLRQFNKAGKPEMFASSTGMTVARAKKLAARAQDRRERAIGRVAPKGIAHGQKALPPKRRKRQKSPSGGIGPRY